MSNIHHRVAVIGAGGWGTTLALCLLRNGHTVGLWSYEEIDVRNIRERGENSRFLPGVSIPPEIRVSTDLNQILEGATLLVMATPSQATRSVLRSITACSPHPCPVVNVSKGIENGSLKRMSQIIAEELPTGFENLICTLSGPSHAEEVSRGIPTLVVAASPNEDVARTVQDAFISEPFRVYTSDDLVGVELAGSLKNVIAIATGIADGLGFGDNTKGAILTRGLAEISRLGLAMGARLTTFSGLAGMGDLITTCMSQHSRNRFVGEQIGKGRTLEQVMAGMVMVAEGVRTTESTVALAEAHGVEVPISREVHAVLFERKPPVSGVRDLMMRPPKPEIYW